MESNTYVNEGNKNMWISMSSLLELSSRLSPETAQNNESKAELFEMTPSMIEIMCGMSFLGVKFSLHLSKWNYGPVF